MASTWSALQIELLETGANSGTWGTATNVNLGDAVLGEAITGSATVDFPTDADVTLTLTNAATSQAARNLRLNITESSTGVGSVRNLILGSNCQIEKFYLVRNNGTGVKTIKNTSGTGVAVAAGKATLVYNDGTNVVDVLNSFSSAILGAQNAGSIIPFYFANQAAFPSASTYHGAIAHSHADGAMYFAHSGAWVRMLDADTDVTVAQGGTGLSTLTANNVILGNGTSTPLFVAPSTSGNVLTSNGTTWASTAPATSGTVTSVAVSGGTTGLTVTGSPITSSGTITLAGTVAVANGGTGLTAGTSGGVLAYTAAGTLASSTALAANNVVVGGGAGAAPSSTNILKLAAAVTSGSHIQALGYADTVVALGNTGVAQNIDLTSGNVFTATLTGNCTFTVRFPVATGASSFTLILTNDATPGRTVAYSGGTFKLPGGSVTRTTTANAIDIWFFFTPDGGTTYFGSIPMANLS